MDAPHYLDHHSTTPCLPEVVDAMLPFFSGIFGNPSAITHDHGRRAGKAVEQARVDIAAALGVDVSEVYFTAGATESNNIALNGVEYATGDHLLVSAIEHKSILVPLEVLRRRGVEVEIVPVDSEGFVSVREVEARVKNTTRLLTVMMANGEIGTIEPCEELAAACASRQIRFHTDATQAVGKIPLGNVPGAVTSLSLSAHKFYGPKGVGALIVRRGTRMQKGVAGGGQEKGLRSGTLNVPGVVGMAKALQIALRDLETEGTRLTRLREHLRHKLCAEIPDAFVHGPAELRLPGNLNVSFRGVDAEELMLAMRRFSLSSGAACSSGDREPSHVLQAIGAEGQSRSSIRIGMGRSTTEEVVDMLVDDLKSSLSRLR